MASRFVFRARPALVAVSLAAAAALAPIAASAAPTPATPSIASVEQKLRTLAAKNSQVVEQFNQARLLVGQREQAARAAQLASTQADAGYQQAMMEFAQTVQAQYEMGSIGAAGALLDSRSGPDYIQRLNTMQLISSHDADVMDQIQRTRTVAVEKARTAKTMLAQARQQQAVLADTKVNVQKQIATYQDTLAGLTKAQQAAYAQSTAGVAQSTASGSATSSSSSQSYPRATSAGAQAAVNFALQQVGKPYSYGASGPDSYDCSGLTMASWRQGGVSLPHSAADQYNYGHHVSRDSLQPGDLIFFYQPIGHVTIYIGNGKMVSAPTTGENVKVVSLDYYNSDYVGATRLT